MRWLLVIAALTVAAVRAQDCNICGQNNSLQFPQGVVSFTYQGEVRKNSCQNWQTIVKNPNAISDDFCRNELLQYTVNVCRCTTMGGDAVVYAPPIASSPSSSNQTLAPSQGSVSATAPASSPVVKDANGNGSTQVVQCLQIGGTANCTGGSKSSASGPTSMFSSLFWSSLLPLCAVLLLAE